METKVYKPIIKEFLKQDVRVIKVDAYHEYIVCKDMFDVLGLVSENGIWSMPKRKMLEFLDRIDSKDDCKTFAVMLKEHGTKRKYVKKSEIYQFQNRITEDVGCVRDEILKTYATMFKVTEDKEKTYELTLEWSKKKYLK